MITTKPKPAQRTGHSWFSSLSSRMALIFCTLTLLMLLVTQLTEMYGLPFGIFEGDINETITQEMAFLSNTADINKNLLELWLSERRGDASVMAKSPYLEEMAAAYSGGRAVKPSPALTEWIDTISYYYYASVRIIDPVSGKSLVSSDGSQADHPLPAVILNSARQPGHEETITLTSSVAGQSPRLHFIRQVGQGQGRDETPALLLDIAFDIESAVKMLWERGHTEVLGKTGEVLVVNSSYQFLNATRHQLADGKPVVPLLTVIQGVPARLALDGGDGTVTAPDYRGVKVLAAYRHISVNPGISWGLVVKIDESEALEPVRSQLRRVMIYMAAASAFTLFITIIISRRLSRPLRRIARTACEIEAGDLSRRVNLEGSSETMALGLSFNSMVERLAQYQDTLEQTVKNRTEDLLKLSKRQEAILGAIPDIIMEVDVNRVYTWGNNAGFEFFGNDVLGREASFYFEGEQDTYQKTAPLIDGTGEIMYVESWQRRRDGQVRLLAWWCKSLRDEQGRVIGSLSTARDITEAKHAEDEKLQLEAQLQQAQKMESVGRLAGGVAHDFNNMLTVILGHAEMGLMRLDPANPVCTNLMEISKSAERSADLTRQLLAFARKQTVSPRVIDLNETVTNMLKMLQRLIGEDIHLTWQPSPGQCQVKMDPSQIDQILANLCVNARDAIVDAGRITIETGTCSIEADYCASNPEATPGEYVRLIVSDNGKGMDRETLTHIFEPFYTTKETGKGTGLGLATVYGAVKQNNGFINIYSEPGKGTTFSIHIPRHTGNTIQNQAEGDRQAVPRGQETILLVEDEAAILDITTIMLEEQGYTVLRADSPGRAMELVRECHGEIHLLMTDVIMPEMNGRDLARNILEIHPGMKRLFMSGYTADVIASHGVLDEGVHFIQKPFSLNDMASMVREVLDKP